MVDLLQRLMSVPSQDRDAYVDRELGFRPPPPDEGLPQGGVPYLPATVDDIVAVVREVPLRPTDTFVDLGSGLGRVAIIAHLLSGARAHGVEVQERLVRLARERAAALGVERVTFEHTNVVDAELDGNVFFLYSPFNGETLKRVLKKLEALSKKKRIALAAVDIEFPHERWLRRRDTSSLAVTIYESVEAIVHASRG
jgi:predicted RNA methylase